MITETLYLKEVIILPELFLGISLVYLLIYCSFLSIQKSYPLIQNSIFNLGILILFFVCYLIIKDPINVLEISSFNNSFVNDYLGYFSKFIISLLALFWILISKPYIINQKFNNFEYILLILFSILGMLILCSSNDLITAYLAIELQSLSFYVLASFNKNSTFSVESGVKYFILGAFASSLFLLGSSFLYGLTGTVNFEDFKDLFYYPFFTELDSISSDLISNLVLYNSLIDSLEPILADKIINDSSFVYLFPSIFELGLFSESYNYFIDNLVQYNIVYSNISYLLSHLILKCNLANLIDTHNFYDLFDEDCVLVLFSELEILNSYTLNNLNSINFLESELINISLLLIASSLFFKLTIAPFHSWAVDVYENSPTPSTFFFAVVPKISFFVLFIRIYIYSFSDIIESFRHVFVIFVVLSVIIGSLGGISQKKLKSLLVYSSISHMGYCVMAVSTSSNESIQMLLCYLVIYSFSGLCIWSILTLLNLKTNYKVKKNKQLTDFCLLYKSNFMLAFFFAVALFSLAGLPPLIGFLVKISLFLTAVESSLYFITFVSMITSVIAGFYYLKLVKIVFFENNLVGKLYYPVKQIPSILLSFLFLFFILLFINPTFLYLFFFKLNLLISAFI